MTFSNRMSFPLPFCSLCHKDVDSVSGHRINGKYILVARCHGDVWEKVMDESKIESMEIQQAFSEKSRSHLKGRFNIRNIRGRDN